MLPTGTITHSGQQGAGSVLSQLPSDRSCSNMCGWGQIASRASSGVEAVSSLFYSVKPEEINLPGIQAGSVHIHGKCVCTVLVYRSQYRHNEVALYGDSSGPEQSVFISSA